MRYIHDIDEHNDVDNSTKEDVMTTPNTNTVETAGEAIADLDLMLADLEVDASEPEPVEEIVKEIIEQPAEEVLETAGEDALAELEANAALGDDELKDLAIGLGAAEVYASAESTPIEDASVKAEKKAKKGKAAKEAKAPKEPKEKKDAAPRTPRDISTVAPEFFVLSGDPAALDAAALDANKATVRAAIPSQKKIAEKFENLFTALSVNKAPSTYVMIAFKLLDDKKTVSSADIVGAYKTSGLGEGTARSQSGQIMNLFATVGIATRTGQTLTLKGDSKIAERIRSLPTAA